MDINGDQIALAVLQEYDKLPQKAKPLNRGTKGKEWVPLSGIVASGKFGLSCISVA